MTDRPRTVIADPAPAGIGAILRAALPIPQDDREARAERRLLHRVDLREAVRR